jgi:hypothetical protein
MISLQDCRYSAFVSYAHADDHYWGGWISQFCDQLLLSLNNSPKLRGKRPPPLHLSGDNGPVSGRLSDELRERVAASFAMVIVVHENYAQSEWCLRELEYFREVCGDDSYRDRLYVVAMSVDAIERVTASPGWQGLLPGADQLWMPFYETGRPQRPLDVFMSEGVLDRDFREPFERLRDDLVDKLKLAAGLAPQRRAAAEAVASPWSASRPMLLPEAAPNVAPVLLFGCSSAALQPKVHAVMAQLAARGVQATELSAASLDQDFAEFAQARQLVLPFDDQPPWLAKSVPGGVLAMQRNAWLAQGHAATDLMWLDLRTDLSAEPEGAARFVADLDAATISAPQLLDRLETASAPPPPPDTPRGVRIFIESNARPGEHHLWMILGDQIRRRWYALFPETSSSAVPPLTLDTVGLPVDELDAVTGLDTADGVVLLWGRKDSRSLQAQIDRVLRKLPPSREAVPGLVAYLMPPQVSEGPVPAWIWQVLRFDVSGADVINVVDEEEDDLQRFLRRVLRRRLARDTLLGVAPLGSVLASTQARVRAQVRAQPGQASRAVP